MPRRIVSFTPSGAYVFRNLRHTTTNYPLVLLEQHETTVVHFDLAKYLSDDEIITGTAIRGHGAMVEAITLAADGKSFDASGITPSAGYAEITVTTSAGETITTRLYVRERGAYWQDRYNREMRL